MNDSLPMVPKLRDIMTSPREIPADLKVREVVEIFRQDSSLLVLPLISGGGHGGSVSRRNLFFRHLSRKYAMDLYGGKPIALLKDEAPLEMGPGQDITSALAGLLAVDPTLETDAFPVVEDGRCQGVVSVADLMMKISASQNSLLETLRALSARIREEVAQASRIQQDLLPDPEFACGGISVGAGITTSTEIGGDFYDYFTVGQNGIGLFIADVSGHGVQSGMVTTAAKASLHTLLSFGVTTPAELLSGMNRAIIATARRSLLMTCLIAVIDTDKKRLTYANAGHNFPYRYCAETGKLVQLAEISGFPLGFEDDTAYREYTAPFSEGDALFLYTDGIVECRDGAGEEFGYDRLEKILLDRIEMTPRAMVRSVLEQARDFAGSSSLEDDATALVASFVGTPINDHLTTKERNNA